MWMKWTSMNHWWNDADRKNQSAQTTPVPVPIHSVKKKSHMDWPESGPGLCDEYQVTAWSMAQLSVEYDVLE